MKKQGEVAGCFHLVFIHQCFSSCISFHLFIVLFLSEKKQLLSMKKIIIIIETLVETQKHDNGKIN